MKKEKIPPIHPAKEGEFIYGNCVSVALAQAFGIPTPALKIIFRSLNMNIADGCNFWECTKVITLLCKEFNKRLKYTPNTTKITYKQLVNILTEGKVLTMFDIHLSYMENGQIFDSYYYNNGSQHQNPEVKKSAIDFMERQLCRIPTGWWEIK